MLNTQDASEYLKLSPDGIEVCYKIGLLFVPQFFYYKLFIRSYRPPDADIFHFISCAHNCDKSSWRNTRILNLNR